VKDRFGFIPDPDNPGWLVRPAQEIGRFLDVFGEIRICVEPDGRAHIRVTPEPRHRNINDTVHGGFLLSLADQALFLGPAAMGVPGSVGGSTIELSTQFFAPVDAGKTIDVFVELLRETGAMVFARGLIQQEGASAVAFSGTFKKAR
jgi:acyl-coenzyme A thioesterase PaaI-like protein